MGFLSTAWEKQAGFARMGRTMDKWLKLSLKEEPALYADDFAAWTRAIKNKGAASSWAAKNVPEGVGRINRRQLLDMLTNFGENKEPRPGFLSNAIAKTMQETGLSSTQVLRLMRKQTERHFRDEAARIAQSLRS